MVRKTDATRCLDAGSIPTKKPMKNPSRERMKSELVYLRAEIARLEIYLEALVYQHCQYHGHNPAQRSASYVVALETRLTAERENRQLRAALWEQLRIGHELTSAFVHDITRTANIRHVGMIPDA